MLRLIPRQPRKISPADLTSRLVEHGYSVNKRTVERDLKMLEGLFGLRVDDRSRPHGWCWPANSPALDIRALGDEEALMLSLAEKVVTPVLPSSVSGELRPLFSAAQNHLKVAFGPRRLKRWAQKVAFDPPAQPLIAAHVLPEVRNQVLKALLMDQWLLVDYFKLGQLDSTELDVQPLGLVVRGPMSYLVCTIRDQDGLRVIALNRISRAEILDEGFRAPAGFSLQEFIEQGRLGFGGSRIADVQLRVSSLLAEQLAETPLSADQTTLAEPEGVATISARIPVTPQLRRWVLSHGADIEVIRPASLRQAIIRDVAALKVRYSI
jgi:predicted DNA-binding transcriptional regulator YafY